MDCIWKSQGRRYFELNMRVISGVGKLNFVEIKVHFSVTHDVATLFIKDNIILVLGTKLLTL